MIPTLFAAFGCFVRRFALRFASGGPYPLGPCPLALRLGWAKPVRA